MNEIKKYGVETVTKKYDAIVIGAGHNGLTNGAFLAKAGLDVLMVWPRQGSMS